MTLRIALMLLLSLPATAASTRFSVGATVVRSATVSARLGIGGVSVQSRGALPGQVQIAPPNAAGEVVVTLVY
ncbi:MAG TPA: hypothetical protein VLW85_10135 [Myxococcales bacterium]|nr:hypothetical protein [Myxococcales bacterium]